MLRARGISYLLCGAAVIALLAVAGCGGGGGGPGGSPDAAPPQPTIGSSDIGHLEVHTAQDDAYQMQQFPQAPAGNVFTALSGATFTMVRWLPPEGKLCGLAPGATGSVRISRENGSFLQLALSLSPVASYCCPRWSPDGTRIAVVYGARLIFIIDLRDRSVEPLYEFSTVNSLAWGPDGRIFVSGWLEGQCDIFVLDPAGNDPPRQLTYNLDEEGSLDISPDGKFIAYVYQPTDAETMEFRLRIAPLAGDITQSGEVIISSGGPLWSVRWSPDGKRLAWCTSSSIAVYRVAEGVTRYIATIESGGLSCDWSADARYVLYTDGDDLYRVDPSQSPSSTPVLLRNAWGHDIDAWNTGVHIRRTLVGPTGSDWLGKSPPFGSEVRALVVVHSASGLVSAAAFKANADVTLHDETPERAGSVVVCRATTTGRITYVLEDNGPGHFAGMWRLTTWGTVREVLVVFDASTGRVRSVLPVRSQTTSAAVHGPRVRLESGRLVIGGAPMGLIGPDGKPVPGAGTITEVAFDPQTGEILSWR